MHQADKALHEVKDLYAKLVGTPAPELQPSFFVPFPPGVDPVDHVVEEIEQLKKLSEQASTAPGPVAWVPQVDSFTAKDAWIFRLEIPGVKRENLKVFINGRECLVKGRRFLPEKETELRPISIERPWGPFERRFLLPEGTRPDKVTARYAEGVLELKFGVDGVAGVPQRKEVEVA